jgi:hypothetical protein
MSNGLLDENTKNKVQGILNTTTLVLGGLTLLAYTVNKLLDDDTSSVVKSVFKIFSGAMGNAGAGGEAADGENDKGEGAVKIEIDK